MSNKAWRGHLQKNTHQTQSKQNALEHLWTTNTMQWKKTILKQWANDNGIVEYHTQCNGAKTWNKKQWQRS
jgi:hypothetical protein